MNAMTLNAVNRALLPAAFGALLCGSAFGQASAPGGGAGGILGDRGVREASRWRPRLLVEYSTGGGQQTLTIDAAGNADLVETAAPFAASARLESEEVAGLENAIAPILRLPPRTRPHWRRGAAERTLAVAQGGALVPIPVDDDDATMAALTDWLDDIIMMAKGGALADANKVLEVKVVRPDRRGLSAAGVIYRGDTASAVPYEIDRTGRRRMLAARFLGAEELAALHALRLLADHDDATETTDPPVVVDDDVAVILPILPRGDIVHLFGS